MRRLVQIAAGLAVSGVALWLTLRGKDLGAVWRAIAAADYRYLWLYLAFLASIQLTRVVRWGILLEPVSKVPFRKLNAVCAVGFFAMMVLPFRLGELARPYLVADGRELSVSAALSSVVVERVADGMFVGLLLVISLLEVPNGTPGVQALRTGGIVVSLAFGVLLVLLVVAYRSRALAVRAASALLAPVSPRLAGRVSALLDAVVAGLHLLRTRRSAALFLVLTAVYWGLDAWGMAVLARGFDIRLGFAPACTLLGALAMGIIIPAGPGMLGTFQAALVLGLELFVPRDVIATRGVAWANVLWAAQLGFQTALALVFLPSRHVRIARILERGQDSASKRTSATPAAAQSLSNAGEPR